MALASVDLGGTNIAAAIGLGDGQILQEAEIATESRLGPLAVLERIAGLVKQLAPEGVDALGLGVPGLCDLKAGTTLFLPNLPTQWRGVAVASVLSDSLGCPVYLLNDARMAALGELDFGHGRTVRNFAFFTLGTAGELGHQTILPDGPICGCGSRGCLEVLASAPALTAESIRLIRMGQAPDLNERAGGDLNLVTPTLMARCEEKV